MQSSLSFVEFIFNSNHLSSSSIEWRKIGEQGEANGQGSKWTGKQMDGEANGQGSEWTGKQMDGEANGRGSR